jgi:hypothetical protein
MKTLKKTASLAAVISATLAMAVLSPEAMAHKGKKHTHKKSTSTSSSHSSYTSTTSASDARLRALEDEVTNLRSELTSAKTVGADVAAKQAQLETQVAEEAAKEEEKNNLVFFRGGFAQLAQKRGNELLVNSVLNGDSGSFNQDGWYVGAGMDFRASDDLFGLTELVALDAELMFQYQNYGNATNSLVNNYASNVVGLPVTVENQVTMFTLAASPKFKFNLLENNLRPWIIPFGLALQVVSPPSSGVTVLNPALMLGTGMEYRLWKDIWLGTDFRYQFGGGDLQYKATTPDGNRVLNATTTNGLQVGGYLGIGF